LIAIAAIYLSFIIHPPLRPDPQASEDSSETLHRQPRRSSRNHHSNHKKAQSHQAQDPIAFLADLNVSLPLVASISQEIISLYVLWDQYKEDVSPEAAKLARDLTGSPPASTSSSKQNSQGYYHSQSQSNASTPVTDTNEAPDTSRKYVTPAFLSLLMMKMREMRVAESTPPSSAVRKRGAVNKRLERAQAGG
jgi:cyclin C